MSVPERHYDLAAELLARAVERAGEGVGDLHIGDLLAEVARAHGHDLASELRSSPTEASAGEARPALLERLVRLLVRHGYEPRLAGGVVTMANCPFHALAEEHRALVCHMNHELLSGLAEEAGLPPGSARLDPEPGRCCVTIVA